MTCSRACILHILLSFNVTNLQIFDEIFIGHTLQINSSVLNFNGTGQELCPLLYFCGSGVDINCLMYSYVVLVNLHVFLHIYLYILNYASCIITNHKRPDIANYNEIRKISSLQDCLGKSCIQQEEEDPFSQHIGLKFEEETSEMLHLEHDSFWC